MNLKLETLLSILLYNKMHDVVLLAIMLENNLEAEGDVKFEEQALVPIEIAKGDLLPNTSFSNESTYATVMLELVRKNNPLSLKVDSVYVKMPNGNVKLKRISNNSVHKIVPTGE